MHWKCAFRLIFGVVYLWHNPCFTIVQNFLIEHLNVDFLFHSQTKHIMPTLIGIIRPFCCLHICVRPFKMSIGCMFMSVRLAYVSRDETNLVAAMLIFANKYISFPSHWSRLYQSEVHSLRSSHKRINAGVRISQTKMFYLFDSCCFLFSTLEP